MDKMLIIGGNGFIAKNLAAFYKNKYRMTLLDFHFEEKIDANIDYICGDARDSNLMENLSNDFSIIIHCAATLGIDKVREESILTIENNILSSINILQLALRQKKLNKVIIFSTSEVYGTNTIGTNEYDDCIVSSAYESRWCYAASKLVIDHLAMAYHREKKLPVIIVRPFNVYGPQNDKGAIADFVNKIRNNEEIIINGTGEQKRAWCDIRDFIQGIDILLKNGNIGEIYNIGNPNSYYSVNDLIKFISNAMEKKPILAHQQSNKEDVIDRKPNIEKMVSKYGYEPKYNLEQGIYYILQQNECKDESYIEVL